MKKNSPELIILDCDGVLYDDSELDTNALVHNFNETCKKYIGCHDKNMDAVAKSTKEKQTKGVYNYIIDIANKIGISPEAFVQEVVYNIDYSHIHVDKDNILDKLYELQSRFKICICSNNHLTHINQILQAKFNIQANQLPFEVFDMRYAEENGIFYSKESAEFISKLEKHFGIKADKFLWIDDSQHVADAVKSFGCQTILKTKEIRLIDILNTL